MEAHVLAGRTRAMLAEVCMCYGIFEQYVRIWELLGTAVQSLSLVLWDMHWQTWEIPGDHPHW